MEHKAKFLYDALEVFKDMVQKGECSKQDISYWCSVSDYELERRGASVGQQRWLTKAESSKMLNVSTSTFDRIVLAGGLPKGKKIQGKKNLLWKREDIEQYKRIMLLNAKK
jgi:predicted DNA-binding transcriptional regulator AlpA